MSVGKHVREENRFDYPSYCYITKGYVHDYDDGYPEENLDNRYAFQHSWTFHFNNAIDDNDVPCNPLYVGDIDAFMYGGCICKETGSV